MFASLKPAVFIGVFLFQTLVYAGAATDRWNSEPDPKTAQANCASDLNFLRANTNTLSMGLVFKGKPVQSAQLDYVRWDVYGAARKLWNAPFFNRGEDPLPQPSDQMIAGSVALPVDVFERAALFLGQRILSYGWGLLAKEALLKGSPLPTEIPPPVATALRNSENKITLERVEKFLADTGTVIRNGTGVAPEVALESKIAGMSDRLILKGFTRTLANGLELGGLRGKLLAAGIIIAAQVLPSLMAETKAPPPKLFDTAIAPESICSKKENQTYLKEMALFAIPIVNDGQRMLYPEAMPEIPAKYSSSVRLGDITNPQSPSGDASGNDKKSHR